MLSWLVRKSDLSRTAGEIYGSIVASARQETFFAVWGVPDTYEGRFEMLALHMALVMRRLSVAEPGGAALSRAVAETCVTDLDDNLREIGIGDLVVPRKIKKAAAALFDRHRDYGAALAAGDTAALAEAIASAVERGGAIAGLDRGALARYTERLSGALAVTTDADCLLGKLPLPWPAA